MSTASRGRRGVGNGWKKEDVGGIGSSCLKTGFDGITDTVVRGDEQDVALWTRGAIGPRRACREAGCEMKGKEGGATAGRAFKQGEFAQRETLGPEPVDGLGSDVCEAEVGKL